MPPRRNPRTVADADPVTDGPAFPDPASDPGRVLSTLIAANVPGTVATWAAPDLAEAAGLPFDHAGAALDALVADRIVDVARDGATLHLTVLLAPSLDTYGVVPRWGDPDVAPEPVPSVADVLAEVGLQASGRGRVRAVNGGQGAERLPFEEGEATRAFMERFERLLVECDEWRRRALAAEDRLAGTERQLRAVERRAETSHVRLEAAAEKLRAWADLTRRMQQLVRQADAVSRARPARPRDTGVAGGQPAVADPAEIPA